MSEKVKKEKKEKTAKNSNAAIKVDSKKKLVEKSEKSHKEIDAFSREEEKSNISENIVSNCQTKSILIRDLIKQKESCWVRFLKFFKLK